MKNLNNDNYMQGIYDIINAPEEVYDEDGIIYLDEPEDEFSYGYDDELAWADDITYLDEPEDDEFDLDLGDGFIPLYHNENYQETVLVIDENYVPDEFEYDIAEYKIQPAVETEEEQPAVEQEPYDYDNEDYSLDKIYDIINEDDSILINIDGAESLIKFPIEQTLEEELQVTDISEEDDKIAKAIAKEHMENVKAGEAVGALYGDVETPEDDTSWVDGDDLFGNDINVIIAEDPNKEVEEDDFVEGSFQDWLDQQNQ